RTSTRAIGRTFSPDGAEMAAFTGANKEFSIFDTRGEDAKPDRISLTGEFVWVEDVRWSPSGGWLLFLTSDGSTATSLWVVPRHRGLQRKLLDEPGHRLAAPRWAPTGDAFYYLREGSTGTMDVIKVAFDLSTGEARGAPLVLLTGLDTGQSFSISP